MRRISNEERGRRLVARQFLQCDARSVTEAISGVVALHSSDPVSPHLSLRARVTDFETGDLDDALCEARTLWRLHAMRRTMWVACVDTAATLAASTREVAAKERRRVEKMLAAELPSVDVGQWVADAEADVMALLSAEGDASTRQLGDAIPRLRTEITTGSGKWTRRAPVSSRLLMVMAMDSRIARTRPDGSWRSSQYRWASVDGWFESVSPVDPVTAEVAVVHAYLRAFGPVTMTDVRWWTGWTVAKCKRALAGCAVDRVELEDGVVALMLARDESPDVNPCAALLPALDPTPMGWKDRAWYGARDELFDRNGNVGPTVWWHGRVVGVWAQRTDGGVEVELLDRVTGDAAAAIDAETERLRGWLGDVVVTPRFRTALERELSAR